MNREFGAEADQRREGRKDAWLRRSVLVSQGVAAVLTVVRRIQDLLAGHS